MAKSLRLHDVTNGTRQTKLPIISFWEHWFDTQSQKHQPVQNLDEHRIWENAVNSEILAMDEAKD